MVSTDIGGLNTCEIRTVVAFLILASVFLTAALTFFTTVLSFLGAVFLVTPTGLAPAFLVVVFARGLRAIAGAVSIGSKTRGLELPVEDRVPSRAIVDDICGEGWEPFFFFFWGCNVSIIIFFYQD